MSKTVRIFTRSPLTNVSNFFFVLLNLSEDRMHAVIPHTPCLAWPNCYKGVLCPFKHPEPAIARAAAGSDPAGETTAKPPQFGQPETFDPMLMQTANRGGAPGPYHFWGTTYFPVLPQGPSSPPQYPPLLAPAQWVQPYGNTLFYGGTWMSPNNITSYDPYGVEPSERSQFNPRPEQPLHEASSSSLAMPTGVPQSPIYEGENIDRSGVHYDTPTQSESFRIEQFPYVAPAEQKVGHARRVSVVLKSKEDSDALGLQTQDKGRRRESWQNHGHHATHKVSRPFFLTLLLTFFTFISVDHFSELGSFVLYCHSNFARCVFAFCMPRSLTTEACIVHALDYSLK